jgi:hypothetical protein
MAGGVMEKGISEKWIGVSLARLIHHNPPQARRRLNPLAKLKEQKKPVWWPQWLRLPFGLCFMVVVCGLRLNREEGF